MGRTPPVATLASCFDVRAGSLRTASTVELHHHGFGEDLRLLLVRTNADVLLALANVRDM